MHLLNLLVAALAAPGGEGGGDGDPKGNSPPNPSEPALPEWTNSLTKEDRGTYTNTIKDYPDLKSMVSAHSKARDQLQKAIFPLNENASKEEIAAYNKAIGVPESPDKYSISTSYNNVKIPDNSIQLLKETAHNLGLTNTQAQGFADRFFDEYSKVYAEVNKGVKDTLIASEKSVRDEWKDEYPQRIKRAQEIVQLFFDPDTRAVLDAVGVSQHPGFLRAVYKAAQTSPDNASPQGLSGFSRDEIEQYYKDHPNTRRPAQ